MNRINNIEFLRIVAITAIFALHLFHTQMGLHQLNLHIDLYDKLYTMTTNGQKGVDFFFILSGLFLYLGIIKNPDQNFSQFICKKIVRLWPVMAFGILLSALCSLFGLSHFNWSDNIYALLFLNGTSLTRGGGNIPSWYCSSMLFIFMLFFGLFQIMKDKKFWLLIGVGIYICYSIILQSNDFELVSPYTTFGCIFNYGTMRAWGGIGLGMFIGLWYSTNSDGIKRFIPGITTKIFITILETGLLFFMIYNLMLHKYNHYNNLIYVIVFVPLITIFVLNKGYLSQLLNRINFHFLSRYVYSIFITHQVIFGILKRAVWLPHRDMVEQYQIANIFLTFFITVIVGVLTYHLVEKPAIKHINDLRFK